MLMHDLRLQDPESSSQHVDISFENPWFLKMIPTVLRGRRGARARELTDAAEHLHEVSIIP